MYNNKKEKDIKKKFLVSLEIFFLIFIGLFILFNYFLGENFLSKYKKVISNEIASRIITQLHMFFNEVPKMLNLNNELTSVGEIDVSNFKQLSKIFVSQIRNYPYLTYISFGNEKGEYIGANRIDNNIQIVTSINEDNLLNTFSVNEENEKDQLLKKGDYYDVTTRLWYKSALKNNKPIWYGIYKHANNASLGIGISVPVIDKNNQVLGVFSADQSLYTISKFLETLDLKKNGLAFLAQIDGSIIATSLNMETFDHEKGDSFSLENIPNKKLNSIFPIINSFNNFIGNTNINIEGKDYYYEQYLFEDDYGLKLIIGVLLADKDFSSKFDQYFIIWFFISVIIIFLGLNIMYKLANKLAEPIEKLNYHVNYMSNAKFDNKIEEITEIKEINELINSFNSMQTKLKESFFLLIAQASFTNIGKTLSDIIHQYKTPLAHLNSQVLALEAYLYKTNIKDPLLENFSLNMRKSISFMNETMNNFNNFYKISLEKEVFNLEEEILFIESMLINRIKEINVTISIFSSEKFYCKNFKNAFDNVIMILLENALDIFKERNINSPKIEIRIEDLKTNFCISILDNGLGIWVEPIDLIFNTFITTKNKSSGLGLTMCKMLIESRLNGSIEAFNIQDGACFEIYIPK